jgi:hypothetical protein
MTLREGLIEALARSMYESATRELQELEVNPVPGDQYEWHAHSYRLYGAAAVDAVLDYLTEHGPEWVKSASGVALDAAMQRGDHALADVMLAALRVQVDTGVT